MQKHLNVRDESSTDIATDLADVRFTPITDISRCGRQVRFAPETDIGPTSLECLDTTHRGLDTSESVLIEMDSTSSNFVLLLPPSEGR